MKFRKLGKSSISVSEIGFGAWGLGGNAYGPISEEEATQLLNYSLEKKITFYDTSEVYGKGRSEELIGNAFASKRQNVVICSKGGMVEDGNHFDPKSNLSFSHLESCLHQSLRRLKTDYLDVYLLHSPTIQSDLAEAVRFLETQKKLGKIRAFGVSARSPKDALEFCKKYPLEIVQVNYNMIDLRAEECGLFQYALENEIGVISRTPLVFGFLAGTVKQNSQFDVQSDHRSKWNKAQTKKWIDSTNLFQFLVSKNRSLVMAALSFCLTQKAIGTVIPGFMKIHEVDENIQASEMKRIDDEELEKIILINKMNNFIIKK